MTSTLKKNLGRLQQKALVAVGARKLDDSEFHVHTKNLDDYVKRLREKQEKKKKEKKKKEKKKPAHNSTTNSFHLQDKFFKEFRSSLLALEGAFFNTAEPLMAVSAALHDFYQT
jgi:ATP adenylyltransferase/5',5'''-P-1,P-4-tetraphosphate phosphorylase II